MSIIRSERPKIGAPEDLKLRRKLCPVAFMEVGAGYCPGPGMYLLLSMAESSIFFEVKLTTAEPGDLWRHEKIFPE